MSDLKSSAYDLLIVWNEMNTGKVTQLWISVCARTYKQYTDRHVCIHIYVALTKTSSALLHCSEWYMNEINYPGYAEKFSLMTYNYFNGFEIQKVRRLCFFHWALNIKCLWLTVMKTQFHCYLNYLESISTLAGMGKLKYKAVSESSLSLYWVIVLCVGDNELFAACHHFRCIEN